MPRYLIFYCKKIDCYRLGERRTYRNKSEFIICRKLSKIKAEILEKMRPTIVVNEMFAFRADAAGSYDFKCLLVDRTLKDEDYDYYDDYYSEDSDDDPDFDPETEDSEEDDADEEMEIDINEDEGSEKEDDKGGVDAAAGIA